MGKQSPLWFLLPLVLTSFFLIVSGDPENHYKVLFAESNKHFISVVAKFSGTQKYYNQQSNLHLLILNFTVLFQSPSEFRVTISDRLHKRWQSPEQDPYPHDKGFCLNTTIEGLLYKVDVKKSPFSFKVSRVATDEVLFNTEDFNFIMSDRYLEFSSTLPTEDTFGFGERVADFKLQFPGKYTIWARDLPSTIDDLRGGLSTYGLFPLYLNREKQGFFNLVYLRNSNGMDVILDKKGNTPIVTYKITGGIVDLKFFLSEKKSPEEVVKSYHTYIGGYVLPPFWSFGFHQCRWGYKSWNQLNNVLNNYHTHGMPLDAIWMDIDYMQDYRIFTFDESRYNLNEMNNKLKNEYKKRLVLILDPGVKVDESYYAYTEGKNRDIFIKHVNGQSLTASVWPGNVHFPDFMKPEARKYWGDMLEHLHQKVHYDGIWLDMNELSNFVNGAVCSYGCFSTSQTCGYHEDNYYYVYNPGGKQLDEKAVCLNALHYDGTTEYDVHNFNGYFETIATYDYLKDVLKQPQPFILTRSTVPGSGKYAAHWTGDNVSTYRWMMLSIAGLVNFNIFGVPHVGADICGFDQWTTENLCRRWMQLGALYPFSRNHNHINSRDQDPFAFGQDLINTSMTVLKFRYSLLKYYYYLFVRNKGTGTIFRPVFFEFPEDDGCFKSEVLEQQFMLGDALLATPILMENSNQIMPYFAGAQTIWYDIETGNAFPGGQTHLVQNDMSQAPPVFLRNGYSIYRQNVSNVVRTDDLNNEIYFSVAFNKNGDEYNAKGQVMACSDYGNYDLLEKCVNGDCLINVDFKAKSVDNAVRVDLAFTANNNTYGDSQYETVYLNGLELYGADFLNANYTKISLGSVDANGTISVKEENEVKFTQRNQIKVIHFGQNIEVKKGNSFNVQFS